MKRSRKIAVRVGVAMVGLSFGSAAHADRVSVAASGLSGFVVFSGGGASAAGGYETSIGGHTALTGNIGSNQDLFLQGNPLSGYPAQLNGSAFAGGDLNFGQDLTVGSPGGPLRSVLANGSATISGGANIYGSLRAGSVSLGLGTGIRKAGGVGGNVQYATSYSPNGGSIVEGSVTQLPGPAFTPITLPAATSFTAGGTNQQVPTGTGTLSISPGAWGSLATSRQNQSVTLTSGNYYFDSINTQGGFSLQLDLTSGAPIQLFVLGNITLAQNTTLLVKGEGTGGNYVPISTAPNLASLIYMETHGRFVMGGQGVWGGTVYASTYESASPAVQIGQFANWTGALYAFDTLSIADHGTWTYAPLLTSVPEPTSMALLAAGLPLIRRRRAAGA